MVLNAVMGSMKTLENPALSRENGSVIGNLSWVYGRREAWYDLLEAAISNCSDSNLSFDWMDVELLKLDLLNYRSHFLSECLVCCPRDTRAKALNLFQD
jgi:hypothetical protein